MVGDSPGASSERPTIEDRQKRKQETFRNLTSDSAKPRFLGREGQVCCKRTDEPIEVLNRNKASIENIILIGSCFNDKVPHTEDLVRKQRESVDRKMRLSRKHWVRSTKRSAE